MDLTHLPLGRADVVGSASPMGGWRRWRAIAPPPQAASAQVGKSGGDALFRKEGTLHAHFAISEHVEGVYYVGSIVNIESIQTEAQSVQLMPNRCP